MSDGTTGIQVAPIPTESEMASIRQIFTNVANALVRASELATQVTDLEGRLNKLDHDYTSVMARNDELVTSLNEVRLQRDQAQSDLVQVKASLSDARHDNEQHVNQAASNADEIATLKAKLEAVKADNAQLTDEWSKESVRADSAEHQLAQIKKALGVVDPPKPEPLAPKAEPQPIPSAGPTPQPSPTEVGEQVALTYPDDAGPARPLTEPELATPKYEWDPNKF